MVWEGCLLDIFHGGWEFWKRVESGRDISGLERCTCQRFRGIGEASIHIIPFYRPIPPTSGGGSVSVYDQWMTQFYNIRKRDTHLTDNIKTWNIKGHLIILIKDNT